MNDHTKEGKKTMPTKIISALTLAFALAIPALALADGPICVAPSGDYDADGIANDVDSDEFDSCLLDPDGAGLTNCSTGAGDGKPDVQLCE